jgi:hypothetical protein
MTMVANREAIMKKKYRVNPTFNYIGPSLVILPSSSTKLLKFIKLTKITCVQILGFVENEWCFSRMAFIKNKLTNNFIYHLHLCIQFYAQCFYIRSRTFFFKKPSLDGRTKIGANITTFKNKWKYTNVEDVLLPLIKKFLLSLWNSIIVVHF